MNKWYHTVQCNTVLRQAASYLGVGSSWNLSARGLRMLSYQIWIPHRTERVQQFVINCAQAFQTPLFFQCCHYFYPGFLLHTAVYWFVSAMACSGVNMLPYTARSNNDIQDRQTPVWFLECGESGVQHHSWTEVHWLLLASSYMLGRKCVPQMDGTHQDVSVTNMYRSPWCS